AEAEKQTALAQARLKELEESRQALDKALTTGFTGRPMGPEFARLQNALNLILGTNLFVDGIQGPATTAAVKQLQRRYGLKETGEADDATWKLIDRLITERLPSQPAPPAGRKSSGERKEHPLAATDWAASATASAKTGGQLV